MTGDLADRSDDRLGTVATASGEFPLQADGTIAEEATAVVIYDRLATPCRAFLEVRLEACREYAAERGWTVAAEHVDTGGAALADRARPGLDAALADVQKAANAADRAVLLVYNDGRLSHDALNLASWRYRVDLAGGTVATVERADAISRRVLEERAVRRAAGAAQ